ncbi:MAG: DNA polymerase III subunit delta [Opitutales bacterium]|jgi:DNA polymerase III subunit delta|nr:DNA polymerase III subunit delta [Opitutales bacterium]MDP4642911.1 DNA polymerase III subunit delta [Opitutales bacterium]MDP4776599.1 DNA polymerase III subunit delta [Opitutales bacterium]MDP4878406.1 DNA polymerase III subunit delta [Opitutales bacterium]MDP4882761.1 DNA polymerase III subunit delta [Opitutales bacterium]
MADKPFTFICGEDDYLVSEKGKVWFAEQTKDLMDDLSKEVVDGRSGNIAEVEEAINRFTSAVQTLSLFGERKVVWLKDVNFMANSQTGNAQGTLDLVENLKEMLAGLDPAQVGVLITAHPIYKVRSFYKWVQKNADFTLIDGGKDSAAGLANIIQQECETAGVAITRDAVQLLIGKVNGNTRLIVEETRKLVTFIGSEGGQITDRLVTDLVPNFGDADFFEAADAFYSLKLDWTLEALRRHFFTNSESRPLLGSLQSRNRLLIQLRVLLDAGAIRLGGRGISKSDLEAAAQTYGHHFGEGAEKSNLNVFTQNPWYLGRLAETASKVPLKKLVDFQIAFTEAFEAIIKRPNEQEEVCRELAVRCLS